MTEEDIAYFRENEGYRRIFEGIREKHYSLGRFGGTITLEGVTKEERETLTSHLRREFYGMEDITFSVREFEASLVDTRFHIYSLKEVLESYFGEPLTTRRESEERALRERYDFFKKLYNEYRGQAGEKWLEAIIQGEALGLKRIMQLYNVNTDVSEQYIRCTCEALENLPYLEGKFKRLPVFASWITRDPHTFDMGTLGGTLLLDAICTTQGIGGYSSSEDKIEILYRVGILMDEVSNYVTLSGLIAYRNGRPHPVWEAAYNEKEPLQVPLMNIHSIDNVVSPRGEVFVVENPGVFSAIIDAFESYIPPLICTYGQVKLASLLILDKLTEEGCRVYYSGDFDPEGIAIADRLYGRYGSSIIMWRYTTKDYRKALSENIISDRSRFKPLANLKCEVLKPVAQEMTRIGKAGYQEIILDNLISDIKSR